MPYILSNDRVKYDEVLNKIPEFSTKGDLEYCIFKLMIMYMSKRERKYSILHDITYSATHCADEFRRRFLDTRENNARETNGDVI
jgi:hypothetical protein